MNQAQEAHVKAMAHKMRILAETIVQRMKNIEDSAILRYPISEVENYLRDSLFYCDAIRNAHDNMLPKLPKEG